MLIFVKSHRRGKSVVKGYKRGKSKRGQSVRDSMKKIPTPNLIAIGLHGAEKRSKYERKLIKKELIKRDKRAKYGNSSRRRAINNL